MPFVISSRAVLAARALPIAVLGLTTLRADHADAATPTRADTTHVDVTLTEWSVSTSTGSIAPGVVTFTVKNSGKVPHAFEVEGRGIEKETPLIAPGASGVLTLTLKAGRYEIYCPVGNDSHKKLGMLGHLSVGTSETPAFSAIDSPARATPVRSVRVIGGGPVVQILPGPYPFADSARAVIESRPADQRADLTKKAAIGPYSDSVARITGTISIRAWDRGPERDSVAGEAEITTQDGARWRIEMDRVQTVDLPNNPRFGGVITGLYYHGASNNHTPLVPTIQSALALWAYAHVYRNDELVTDTAMVHVMLLSRTRRANDFHLSCWDCAKNPIEELQLQVTTPLGTATLPAPGGFLFVNWERAKKVAARKSAD